MARTWLPLALVVTLGCFAWWFFSTPASPPSPPESASNSSTPLAAAPPLAAATPQTESKLQRNAASSQERAANSPNNWTQGLVEVEVVDEEGHLLSKPYRVNLHIYHPAVQDPPQASAAFWSLRSQNSKQGLAVFENVGLDRKIKVEVQSVDGWYANTVDSKTSADGSEKTVLKICPYGGHAVITGRILNEKGVIGRNLRFACRVDYGNGRRELHIGDSLRTDSQGRFFLVLSEDFHADDSLQLTITRAANAKHPEREVRSAKIPYFGPKTYDLGNLVLQELPLLAAGKLLTAGGQPLSNIEVAFSPKLQNLREFDWSGESWSCKTDANGFFEIRGRADPAKKYQLEVFEVRLDAITRDVRIGETDIEIVITMPIMVTGILEIDANIPRELLQLKLYRPGANAEDAWDFSPSFVEETGHFAFVDQQPGTAVLVVSTNLLPETLYTSESFLIQADPIGAEESSAWGFGPSGLQMQLDTIDLRGQLNLVHLRVVDEDQQPIPRPWVWIAPMETGNYVDQQPIVLIRGPQVVDLLVGADDRPYRFLGDVRADTTITLGHGLEVEVQLRETPQLEEGWSLQGGLFLDQRTDNYWDPFTTANPPLYQGTVAFAGDYRVAFYLFHLTEEGWDEGTPVGPPADFPLIQVQEQSTVQHFIVPWDVAKLRQTMDQILAAEREASSSGGG